MYHYVRNNEDESYDTYCRRKNEFEAQIEFFAKNSLIINPLDTEKINYHLKNDQPSFLLTFDDGYKDHLYCAEYLYSKNLSAYFFPPINAINGELLDVNAIHMLIGQKGLEVKKLLLEIENICLSKKFFLELNGKKLTIKEYFENFQNTHKYDRRHNQMLKKILQRDLIGEINRKYIINILLKKYIGRKTSNIAEQLYLSVDNLIAMRKMGMIFGSHGYNHKWLSTLNFSEQKYEIEESFNFLRKLNLVRNSDPMTICYPYGSYNKDTLDLMDCLNLDFGFTTEVSSSKLKANKDYIFKLPRWNTNNCWNNEWRRPCLPN